MVQWFNVQYLSLSEDIFFNLLVNINLPLGASENQL